MERQWETATDEMHESYGRRRFDLLPEAMAYDATVVSSSTMEPVVDAYERALFEKHPRARYLVTGSSGWFDRYMVNAIYRLTYEVI